MRSRTVIDMLCVRADLDCELGIGVPCQRLDSGSVGSEDNRMRRVLTFGVQGVGDSRALSRRHDEEIWVWSDVKIGFLRRPFYLKPGISRLGKVDKFVNANSSRRYSCGGRG